MTYGSVYVWIQDRARRSGGHVASRVEPLLRLETGADGRRRLSGRYVHVRNAGAIPEADPATGAIHAVPIGDAEPDAAGDFLFEPARGGGRMDKRPFAEGAFRRSYIQASHFGEVNTYYHLDRIAAYVDSLLGELRAPSLPRVIALVNAHHAATEKDGVRDGVWKGSRWRPFQGGHYRLPSKRYDVAEHGPISRAGEIHLGPGYRLLRHGALVEATGTRYRHNSSHNAGILYHEYGHHITRHTADFWANGLRRRPKRQKNRKTALDEGTCDYWAATLLGTPHIWAWHRRHDDVETHRRSLVSPRTMADFDASATADPHVNGTIWAAALWDVRTRLEAMEGDGGRRADLLVLQALLLLGKVEGDVQPPTVRSVRRARERFATGLAALLQADELLHAGRHGDVILAPFSRRGIQPEPGFDAAPAVLEGAPFTPVDAASEALEPGRDTP